MNACGVPGGSWKDGICGGATYRRVKVSAHRYLQRSMPRTGLGPYEQLPGDDSVRVEAAEEEATRAAQRLDESLLRARAQLASSQTGPLAPRSGRVGGLPPRKAPSAASRPSTGVASGALAVGRQDSRPEVEDTAASDDESYSIESNESSEPEPEPEVSATPAARPPKPSKSGTRWCSCVTPGQSVTQVYEVTGTALDSIRRSAHEQWSAGRVLDKDELDFATEHLNQDLVRTMLDTWRPEYTIVEVVSFEHVVMVTMARPKEHPLADIEMGSLTARPVTEKRQISRIHSTVREVFVSPVQELGRKKKQEKRIATYNDKLQKLDDATNKMGKTLKKILEIMWMPEEMKFRPVGTKWKETGVGWLTTQSDEASPRVRRLYPGESFMILDLREKQTANGSSIVRVRTRHGWLTWGKCSEINNRDQGKSNEHFRRLYRMQRADSGMDSPALAYAQDMAIGDVPKLRMDAVIGREGAVWVDMKKLFDKDAKRIEALPATCPEVRDVLRKWACRPRVQRKRWFDLGAMNKEPKPRHKHWKDANPEAAHQAKVVSEAALRALKQVPFFHNVPAGYLEQLAGHTAISLQRFRKGERIVRYIGGHSFPQTSLAEDVGKPVHQISLRVDIAVPSSITAESLDAWIAAMKTLAKHRLRSVAGGVELEEELENLGSNITWADRGGKVLTVSDLLAESLAVRDVGAKIVTFLKQVKQYVELMVSECEECKLHIGDLFREADPMIDGFKQPSLMATLLLDVTSKSGKDQKLMEEAVQRLFGSEHSRWSGLHAVQFWWSALVSDVLNPGDSAEDSWNKIKTYLNGHGRPTETELSKEALDSLTVADIDGLLKVATATTNDRKSQQDLLLTEDQAKRVRAKIPGLKEILAGAAEESDFDRWLKKLNLLDKKKTFEGYEVNEEDPFGVLKGIEDDWDDLIEDGDLELDEEGQVKLRAALEKLPELGLEKLPAPELSHDAFGAMCGGDRCFISHARIARTERFGAGMMSKKLYIVQQGRVKLESTGMYAKTDVGTPTENSKSAKNPRMCRRVLEGDYFGEAQLLRTCDIECEATAIDDYTLLWMVDEDTFAQFRGLTMLLLETVAARLQFCQQRSYAGAEGSLEEPPDGVPCYLDQHAIKQFDPLVDPADVDKQSEIAINLYANDCDMFGSEQLRVLLTHQVNLRSLMLLDTNEGEDAAELVAGFMEQGQLSDLEVLEVSVGPYDRGLCELLQATLMQPLTTKDGKLRMRSFTIAVSADTRDGNISQARKQALYFLAKEEAVGCRFYTAELHRMLDHPLDLMVYMTKMSKILAAEFDDTSSGYATYATRFEEMACDLLNECNSLKEAELLLTQSRQSRPKAVRGLMGNSANLMEYALEDPAPLEFTSTRLFTDYAEDVWVQRQVSQIQGLLQTPQTHVWAETAYQEAKCLANPTASLTSALKCILWIVLSPFAVLFLHIAKKLVTRAVRRRTIDGSGQWRPLQAAEGESFFYRKVWRPVLTVATWVYVSLDATARMPAVVAITWVGFHTIALGITMYVAIAVDVKAHISLTEHVVYTLGFAEIMGELHQLSCANAKTGFLFRGRGFDDMPYRSMLWTKCMLQSEATWQKCCGALLWLSLPVWGALLRIARVVVRVFSATSLESVIAALVAWVVAALTAVFFYDSTSWIVYSVLFGLCFGFLVGLIKYQVYSEDAETQFRMNLILRCPVDMKDNLMEELNALASRDALEVKPKEDLAENLSANDFVADVNAYLVTHKKALDIWKASVAAVRAPFGPIFACAGQQQFSDSVFIPDGTDATGEKPAFYTVEVGFLIRVQRVEEENGGSAIGNANVQAEEDRGGTVKSDEVDETETYLDWCIRTENWLLRGTEPHHMQHWNPTRDHTDIRLKRIEVMRRLYRRLQLSNMALDSMLDHAATVVTEHFDEFWQYIDFVVCVGWVANFCCRWQMHLGVDDVEKDSDIKLAHWWSGTICWVVVGLVLRMLNYLMMSTAVGLEITSIIEICRKDVVKFFKLFIILLLTAAIALTIAYRENSALFNNWWETLNFGLNLAFQQTDLEELRSMEHGSEGTTLGTIIFWVYFMMVNIVLLNLLIAMMGSTYMNVAEGSGVTLWRLRRTRTIIEYSTTMSSISCVPPLILLELAMQCVDFVCHCLLSWWLCWLCNSAPKAEEAEAEEVSVPNRRLHDSPTDFHGGKDFADITSAPTPQLALHQRWREQSERSDKSNAGKQHVTREIGDLDKRLRGQGDASTDLPDVKRLVQILSLDLNSTVQEWLLFTGLDSKKERLCQDILSVPKEATLGSMAKTLDEKGIYRGFPSAPTGDSKRTDESAKRLKLLHDHGFTDDEKELLKHALRALRRVDDQWGKGASEGQ